MTSLQNEGWMVVFPDLVKTISYESARAVSLGLITEAEECKTYFASKASKAFETMRSQAMKYIVDAHLRPGVSVMLFVVPNLAPYCAVAYLKFMIAKNIIPSELKDAVSVAVKTFENKLHSQLPSTPVVWTVNDPNCAYPGITYVKFMAIILQSFHDADGDCGVGLIRFLGFNCTPVIVDLLRLVNGDLQRLLDDHASELNWKPGAELYEYFDVFETDFKALHAVVMESFSGRFRIVAPSKVFVQSVAHAMPLKIYLPHLKTLNFQTMYGETLLECDRASRKGGKNP